MNLSTFNSNTNSNSLASEFISRKVVNSSASVGITTGHDANFQTGYILAEPWSLKATDQSSLDDSISIACRYLAESPGEIEVVRSVLSSRVFLTKLGRTLGLDQARLIKKGQPMISLDMLLDGVRKTNRSSGVDSQAADLIMTALLGRALTAFGMVQISDGLLEIEIEDGLIPDWVRMKAESIQRELEVVFGSVSFDGAIDVSQTVGALLLPPLTTLLRKLVVSLEESRHRLLMVDILGAASLVYLQDFANKNTIFNGLLTNETIARMSTNFTFVSQYIATEPTIAEINNLLACAPIHTVANGLANAASGITASGRIKEIDLDTFARNTEFLLLRDLNHMPTKLYMAASYQAPDYKPQVSLFENQDPTLALTPLGALEDALAQYIPSVLSATSSGVLASFANPLTMIEGAKYQKRLKMFDADDQEGEIAKDCCLTSSLFLQESGVVGLMMTEAYLQHLAVGVSDSVIVKSLYSSDGLCATGISEVQGLNSSIITYMTTKRAPDLGDELFSVSDAVFVTRDPAIVIAFGMDLPAYQEALGSWTVGPQTLQRDMRSKDVIGKVIPEAGDESDEYLVPNPKSTLDKAISFALPSAVTNGDALSIDIDVPKALTGVDYSSLSMGKVFMHQLPVLRALMNATFYFLQELLEEETQYNQQIAIAVSNYLRPFMDNQLIHRLIAVGKAEMLLASTECVDRRKMAAALRMGTIDAHMGTYITFDMLRKMQLIDNDLYKSLSENELMGSDLMTTLLSDMYRKKEIQSY